MATNKANTVPCKFCGTPTAMTGTQLCDPCWEVTNRLPAFLKHQSARDHVRTLLGGDRAQRDALLAACEAARPIVLLEVVQEDLLRGAPADSQAQRALRLMDTAIAAARGAQRGMCGYCKKQFPLGELIPAHSDMGFDACPECCAGIDEARARELERQ